MMCACALLEREIRRDESRGELEAQLARVVRMDAESRGVSYARAYAEYVMAGRGELVHGMLYGPVYGRPN